MPSAETTPLAWISLMAVSRRRGWQKGRARSWWSIRRPDRVSGVLAALRAAYARRQVSHAGPRRAWQLVHSPPPGRSDCLVQRLEALLRLFRVGYGTALLSEPFTGHGEASHLSWALSERTPAHGISRRRG